MSGAAFMLLGVHERALSDAPSFEDFFSSRSADELAAEIDDTLKSCDVLSVDVFDTLLLRDEKSELGRFLDIAATFAGYAEAADLSARSALVARLEASRIAYLHTPGREGTREGRLEDIAALIPHILHLPPDQHATEAKLWIDTEMAIEASQLRLSSFVCRVIDMALAKGKRVIALSDMYLSAHRIEHLLCHHGFDVDRLTAILSSADLMVNKRSGTVFPEVARSLNCEMGRILHLGDSLNSDFRMPVHCGWKARLLPIPKAIQRQRVANHEAVALSLFGAESFPLPMARPEVA